MSDFRAIGAVSSTLKVLLKDRMKLPESLDFDKFSVTIGPPAMQPPDDHTIELPRINLFLYQINENPFLRNQEIPGNESPGSFGCPPLSLNLHYMLTAYGTKAEENWLNQSLAHYLLGSAMRVLHDHPMVSGDIFTIKDIISSPILDSSLQNEKEMLKITLYPMGLEDTMKIWTALMVPYRPSVFYEVNVVQIESDILRRYPSLVGQPPLRGPKIITASVHMPRIDELRVKRGDDPSGIEYRMPYARIEDTLMIFGSGFSQPCSIAVDELQLHPGRLKQDAIELFLPDVPELNPGPKSVIFQAKAMMGQPPSLRTAASSNQAVFMLVPHLKSVSIERDEVPRQLLLTGTRLYVSGMQNLYLIGNTQISSENVIALSSTEVKLAIPDSLPSWPASCLVSGTLSEPLPSINGAASFRIAVGTGDPVKVELPMMPKSLSEAAMLLQSALRRSTKADPVFLGFRVAAMGNRLVLLPGQPGEVSIEVLDGNAASALKLRAADGAVLHMAYLSGDLEKFPVMTSENPGIRITIGTNSRDVHLKRVPVSAADASKLLEEAIVASSSPNAFSELKVVLIAGQLLIIPGASGSMNFGPIPDEDETSVSELRLKARYRIRVRVNGSESIDARDIELP